LQSAAQARWRMRLDNGDAVALDFTNGEDANSKARFSRGGAKYEINRDNFALGIEAGALAESDTFLGAHFNGGFALDGGGDAVYARIAALLSPGEDWRGYASYLSARARARPAKDAIIKNISEVRAAGFHFGLAKRGIMTAADSLRADIIRPLAATKGAMDLEYIGGYVDDPSVRGADSYRADRTRVNLAGNPATIYALVYRRDYRRNFALALGAEYIAHSPARNYRKDETILSASLRGEF
jgi:hypothetical protein